MFAFVGLYTPDGILIEANRAPLEAAGLERKDVIGKPFWDTYWWSYSTDAQTKIREVLKCAAAGETVRDDFKIRVRGGQFIVVDATFGPVHDDAGKVIQLVGSGVDVTARVDAERELRRTHDHLEAMLAAMPDLLFEIDRDGRYLDFRASNRELLAVPPELFIGRTMQEILPPDVVEVGQAALAEAAETGVSFGRTYRLAMPDGEHWFELAVARKAAAKGGTESFIVLARDVTERKRAGELTHRLNAELEHRVHERTLELAAANQALESFAYSVSHDLKAPLRAIDGYSAIVLNEHGDKVGPDGRRKLASIREAASRMSELVDALLSYARLEHDEVEAQEVVLEPLIALLLAERADEIESGSAVRVRLSCNSVWAQPIGLRTAVRNLLDNALKFTRGRENPEIEIGARDNGTAHLLWVTDNGVGFDTKLGEHIFNMFYRISSQENTPGTGIGLAMVRKAMQRMGGRAWAEGVLGSGATFYLEIPKPSGDRLG